MKKKIMRQQLNIATVQSTSIITVLKIAKLKAMSYEKELNYRGAIKYYQQYLAMNPNAADKQQITKKNREI